MLGYVFLKNLGRSILIHILLNCKAKFRRLKDFKLNKCLKFKFFMFWNQTFWVHLRQCSKSKLFWKRTVTECLKSIVVWMSGTCCTFDWLEYIHTISNHYQCWAWERWCPRAAWQLQSPCTWKVYPRTCPKSVQPCPVPGWRCLRQHLPGMCEVFLASRMESNWEENTGTVNVRKRNVPFGKPNVFSVRLSNVFFCSVWPFFVRFKTGLD